MVEGMIEIRIACKGAETVSLDDLTDLQGNLKTLSEKDYVKLRNSIIEFGFSFPIFYWEDARGVKWIIDSHQRCRVLRKMKAEGYVIPPLPADPIFAKDKVEAKKKLLLVSARYGKITESGMFDYVTEEGYEIPFEEVQDYLTYPEADYSPEKKEDKQEEEQKQVSAKDEEVICPNCGNHFTPVASVE